MVVHERLRDAHLARDARGRRALVTLLGERIATARIRSRPSFSGGASADGAPASPGAPSPPSSRDRAAQDPAQRARQLGARVRRGAHAAPRDEAVGAHQDRAVAAELSAPQPRATRVAVVAVDVSDAGSRRAPRRPRARLRAASIQRPPSSAAISGKRPGRTTSLIATRSPSRSPSSTWGSGEPGRVPG